MYDHHPIRALANLDDRFHEIDHGTDDLLADSSFVFDQTRSGITAGWRRAVELAITDEEIENPEGSFAVSQPQA